MCNYHSQHRTTIHCTHTVRTVYTFVTHKRLCGVVCALCVCMCVCVYVCVCVCVYVYACVYVVCGHAICRTGTPYHNVIHSKQHRAAER